MPYGALLDSALVLTYGVQLKDSDRRLRQFPLGRVWITNAQSNPFGLRKAKPQGFVNWCGVQRLR